MAEKVSGKFIVVEGLEKSGKTRASKQIVHILQQNGIENILLTREPGGTPLSEKFRKLIKKGIKKEPLLKKTELLIVYASRLQLVENVIKPSLRQGIWIVGDRHDLSSHAYQGGGRGIDLELIKQLKYMILKNFQPDLTIYLDIPPKISFNRIRKKKKMDRIEKEPLSFFERTYKIYKDLSKNQKIITIDANQSMTKVSRNIKERITNWLNNQRNL